MDWRRLVTDDANETDLLRSYAVRVTDASSAMRPRRPQPRVGLRPRMDAKECGRCSSVVLCGSSDPSQMTTALAWSLVTATSGMSRRRRTGRWSNGGGLPMCRPAQRSLNRANGMLLSCSRLTGPEAKKTPAAGRETTARPRRLGLPVCAVFHATSCIASRSGRGLRMGLREASPHAGRPAATLHR